MESKKLRIMTGSLVKVNNRKKLIGILNKIDESPIKKLKNRLHEV